MDPFGHPAPAASDAPEAAPAVNSPGAFRVPPGASGPRAGFWSRLVALLVDWGLILAMLWVLTILLRGVGLALTLLIDVGYFVFLEGGPRGQTIGKRVMGIRVIGFDTGGPIGYGRALVRWFGRILSGVALGLGYLWMLWQPEKQCWHDSLAVDVVVPESAYPPLRSANQATVMSR